MLLEKYDTLDSASLDIIQKQSAKLLKMNE